MYTIRFTNNERGTIQVGKSALITDNVDVALVGKKRREYGQIFNENVLHILENFACPEDASNPQNPDITVAFGELLERPIEGQLWYNSTRRTIYSWDGAKWVKIRKIGDIASNSGVINHGQFLPLPVGTDGTTFTYDECSMFVSPYHHPEEVDYTETFVEDDGLVTSRYRIKGNTTINNGSANYFIVGIKADAKDSDPSSSNPPTVPPTPSVPVSSTPTPTPSPTASPAGGVTPTPTPLPSSTPVVPIEATLYIAPSDGDLGTPTTSGGNDELLACDSETDVVGDCEQTLYVSVKDISGGDGGPYMVEWNLSFETSVQQFHEFPEDPTDGIYNDVTTTPILEVGTDTNVLANSGTAISFCTIRAGNWGEEIPDMNITSEGIWYIKILSGSYARIVDGSGNSLYLYTPSGMNGNVGGTANSGSTGDYIDAWSSS